MPFVKDQLSTEMLLLAFIYFVGAVAVVLVVLALGFIDVGRNEFLFHRAIHRHARRNHEQRDDADDQPMPHREDQQACFPAHPGQRSDGDGFLRRVLRVRPGVVRTSAGEDGVCDSLFPRRPPSPQVRSARTIRSRRMSISIS